MWICVKESLVVLLSGRVAFTGENQGQETHPLLRLWKNDGRSFGALFFPGFILILILWFSFHHIPCPGCYGDKSDDQYCEREWIAREPD